MLLLTTKLWMHDYLKKGSLTRFVLFGGPWHHKVQQAVKLFCGQNNLLYIIKVTVSGFVSIVGKINQGCSPKYQTDIGNKLFLLYSINTKIIITFLSIQCINHFGKPEHRWSSFLSLHKCLSNMNPKRTFTTL